jgi:hypothetical protein
VQAVEGDEVSSYQAASRLEALRGAVPEDVAGSLDGVVAEAVSVADEQEEEVRDALVVGERLQESIVEKAALKEGEAALDAPGAIAADGVSGDGVGHARGFPCGDDDGASLVSPGE